MVGAEVRPTKPEAEAREVAVALPSNQPLMDLVSGP